VDDGDDSAGRHADGAGDAASRVDGAAGLPVTCASDGNALEDNDSGGPDRHLGASAADELDGNADEFGGSGHSAGFDSEADDPTWPLDATATQLDRDAVLPLLPVLLAAAALGAAVRSERAALAGGPLAVVQRCSPLTFAPASDLRLSFTSDELAQGGGGGATVGVGLRRPGAVDTGGASSASVFDAVDCTAMWLAACQSCAPITNYQSVQQS